jgi:uncharacterized membrane protein HdeD (DUF308 family)
MLPGMGSPRRRFSLVVGICAVVLGATLTLKPFSSLEAPVIYIAAALVVAGVGELVSEAEAPWASRIAGVLLILTNLAALVLPGLTVSAVAIVVGVGMVVGGLSRIVGGVRGRVDGRFAAIVGGLAGLILGVLALTWPDVTVLVVAVLVGPLAVIFGIRQIIRALSGRTSAPRGWPGWARSIGAVAALLLALLLIGVSSFLHEGSPSVDSFYEPEADLPDQPGELLRSEAFSRGLPDGASADRILFTTTGTDGEIEAGSGLVVYPDDARESLPVILWTHGTTGVVRKCAPSALAEPFEAGAMPALGKVLARGWAVVAPDYPGLGTDGPHPYLIGVPEARSALDAVRPARELDDVELSDNTVSWGHSQGGGAALWVGVEAGTYAEDVPVAGVAGHGARERHGVPRGRTPEDTRRNAVRELRRQGLQRRLPGRLVR